MRSAISILATCFVIAASASAASAETLARPGSLRVKKVSQTQRLLTWRDKGRGEEVYIVQRRLVLKNRFLTRAILPPNTTEFVDVVDPTKVYIYRVVARSEEGQTKNSANCFVNRTPPARPTSIDVKLIALTVARVTWDDRSLGETGFRVERRADGMPTFETVGEVGPGEQEFIDRTLHNATTYTYRVRALGVPRHCIKHSRPSREVIETSEKGTRVLSIEVVGAGSGYVVSVPEGINCGPQRRKCSAVFPLAEQVELIPTANGTSLFRRWEGDSLCNEEDGACDVRMGRDRAITARFRKPPRQKDE